MKKYSLSAFEKIKSRKDFESIFTGGETTYSLNNKIRANYKFSTALNNGGVMFAVAVSKKLGNAVWRNRIKRLIREAYRFNKIELIDKCKAKNVLLEIIFSPQALSQIKNQRIGLSEIEPPIKEIITKIKEKL